MQSKKTSGRQGSPKSEGLSRSSQHGEQSPPSQRPDVQQQPTDQWLGAQLSQQADLLSSIRLSDSDSFERDASGMDDSVPTVWQLRERMLCRRERRARSLSLAASAAVLVSVLGWGVQSYRATDPYNQGSEGTIAGELQNLRAVSTSASSGEASGDEVLNGGDSSYRMLARWWEPVTVEWVDEEGRSMGVAGVVAEERTSMIDPRKLSPEQLKRLRNILVEYDYDRARDQFTNTLEPAF